MRIIKDVLDEHLKIKEEIAQLPKVGTVIEITRKDTDNYGGKRRFQTRSYKVMEKLEKNKMVVTLDLKTNTKECFSYYDILTSPLYHWEPVISLEMS